MTGGEVFWLVVGLIFGNTSGLLVMGVLAGGKVERAERLLDDAAREQDEAATRNARWFLNPPQPSIPRQVCLACRLGECDVHGGAS